MLDAIFDALVFGIIITLGVLPVFSIWATAYIIRLYKRTQPRNEVLKTAAITSSLVTTGGLFWAFVAIRRAVLGNDAPALPEFFLLLYGLTLLMILITPIIKVWRLLSIMNRPLTADQIEDIKKLEDRKSTRLNSSHSQISYAVFCLKKKIIKK